MKLKTTAINAVIFVSGVGIGVAAVWKFFDTKYKNQVSKKIDEIMSNVKKVESNVPSELPAKVITEPVLRDIDISEDSKINYSKIAEPYMIAKETTNEKPYVIAPSEFGENGYETISLRYYSDGLLADDMDEVIENIDETVGADSLNHFGEYEDDSVFVRNDRLKVDYEILLDNRKLVDIRRNSPCPLEDEGECED